MTSKFEQLIEYVINDEEAKAKELFHDIVVEKSREIYENLMSEESEEELEESEEELEESEEELEESEEELMNDVEAEEQGMQEEEESDSEFDDAAEEDGEDLTHDMEKDHDDGADIEDRVVDLEDKLDELMAEFESLMGDNGDSVDSMDGGDDLEMDDTDTAEFGDEEMGMMEAVSLSKVAPAKMGDDGANTKSVVPQNSGAKGAVAHPVKMTGDTAQGRPAPKSGELIGKVQNSVGGNKTMSPATKPVTTQAAGVNTKTPFPKG
jgi:hypothetical protein